MYTAAALVAANPLLLKGEVVYESDTRKRKVGDGISKWNDLVYDAGGEQPEMTPVVGADSVADFLGTSAPMTDVLQKVIAATAIGKVRQVRYGGLQCMVWLLEGTTTVGVLGFAAEESSLVYGAVDEGEFPAGIFDITDEEIAVTVLNTCTGIGLDAIPAAHIATGSSYRFVSDSEKSTWNNKAEKNLSNVSLTKSLAERGYYKAPDGLMFQWGTFTGSSSASGITVYFPTSFYSVIPFAVLTTCVNVGSTVTVPAALITSRSTSSFVARTVWANSGSQGHGQEAYMYLAIGRWK